MDEPEEEPRVYGPKDWRELNGAPLPTLPASSVPCAAIKDDGAVCGNKAMHGTPFCRMHGGTTLAVQEQARRRIDAVRSELFEHLVTSAREAVEVYTTIMKTGKRDADRLKAADRVLELLGVGEDVATVAGKEDKQESDIDKQLQVLLVSVTQDRLQKAIETTVVEHDDSTAEQPDTRSEDEAALDPASAGEATHAGG